MIVRRQTSIKVDPVAWDSTKEIFKEYNLSVTDAINMFLNRVRLERGLPFELKLPSDRTLESIEQIKRGDVVSYTSDDPIAEMMKDLKSWSFKKQKLSDEEESSYVDVLFKLLNGIELEKKYKDHQLKGNMKEFRECHIKPDLLLMYGIIDDVLELVNIGSHSEIFKK